MSTYLPHTHSDSPVPAVPPVFRLESGDRLSGQEFERRYAAMPNLKKAELVEGVVYVSSPVSEGHSRGQARVIHWLSTYELATAKVSVNSEPTLRLDKANVVQPDVLMRLLPEAGGRCSVSPDNYLEGPPELICEVASSSASYDLHSKMQTYLRTGVQEYLVWRILDGAIDWFELRENRYEPLPIADGIVKSRVYPGLWLDREAMLRHDLARVIAVVQQGLASPEHEDFIQRLAATRK